MNKGLIISLLFLNMFTHSQTPVLWDSLGGIPSNSIDCLLGVDSTNSLFAVGDFTNIGSINSWGIAKYNNKWDSIPGGIGNSQFSNMPNSMKFHSDLIWYKHKLYIGDVETWHNKEKTGPLGIWDGFQWQNLINSPFLNRTGNSFYDRSIMSFKEIDDTLYIGGIFDSVGNQKIDCIVKYDGLNFHSLNFNNPVLGNRINCIEKYKNEIYVAGNLLDSTNAPIKNMWRIYRYNGSTWYNVGNGVRGGNAQINSMVIYKGYLYVAGWFTKADGNAGNYIMKWDGSNWYPIPNGVEGTNGEILKLLVYNDKLYVFGDFTQAGDIPASRMAVYNGKQWCDLGGQTFGYVKSATFFKDTLYVGGNFGYIGNQNIWYIAKRLAGDYHDTCGYIIDTDTLLLTDTFIKNTFIKLFPNPFNDQLNIELSSNFNYNMTQIIINNYLGQMVYLAPFSKQIDLSNLSSGMYFLTVQDRERKQTFKIVKE